MLPTFARCIGAVALGSLFACSVHDDTLAGGSSPARHAATQRPLVAPGSLPAGADTPQTGPRGTLESLSRGDLWSAWNSMRGDAYALDSVERFLEPGERLVCDASGLVRHAGAHVRYRSSVQVYPAFRDRLIRFEQLVSELGVDIYGRAPTRLSHFGAYSCRPSRNRSHRLSEHALGNAIDVTGFEFAAATKQQTLTVGLPAELRRPFRINVARHWNVGTNSPSAAVHARFLRELALRLSDRDDVFRGMIGPSRKDHADHFHFDMSPWRYVRF